MQMSCCSGPTCNKHKRYVTIELNLCKSYQVLPAIQTAIHFPFKVLCTVVADSKQIEHYKAQIYQFTKSYKSTDKFKSGSTTLTLKEVTIPVRGCSRTL